MIRIVILTGAGLSAESGIRTFRYCHGLWEEHDVMEVCSVDGFAADREKVNAFYDERRHDLEEKDPNEAHRMLARVKQRYGGAIAMLTQNVDNLLEQAGCPDVIHLHGTLTDLRCERCDTVFPIGYRPQSGIACPSCGSARVRHNVVMFGEEAPAYRSMHDAFKTAEMFIAIGTSGRVVNIRWYAQWYDHTVLNNLDPDETLDPYFKTVIHAKASAAAARIEALIDTFLR